ncbi:tyrosine-type recombinase/integrase [Streptomyces beijiangensis]
MRYREPGGRAGRQREASFEEKAQADAFAEQVEQAKAHRECVSSAGPVRTLVDVYREFIDCGERVNGSRYQYETSLRLHVKPYFRSLPIGAVKPKDLYGWLQWMVEVRGYESSTALNRYRTLSGVFSYAVANDYLPKSPCQHVRVGRRQARRNKRKVIHLPTLAEIQAIADQLPGPYRLLVWLMAGCGLRIGEASAVTVQQIDFAAGTLYVDRQITQDGESPPPRGRGRRAVVRGRGRAHCIRHLKWRDQDEGRLVPMPVGIALKVREHLERYGTFHVEEGWNRLAGEYLFANVGRTNILMYSLVSRLWHRARKADGITRKITTHWLRHFFASAGLAKGVPVTEMAEWLGHRDQRVTFQTYAHVMPDASERLRFVMDAVFSGVILLRLPLQFEAVIESA